MIKGNDEFCIQVGLLGNLDPSQCRAVLIYDIGTYEVGTSKSSAHDDPMPNFPASKHACGQVIDASDRDNIGDMGRCQVKHLSQTLIVCRTLLLDQVPFFDYNQFRALDYNRYEENLLLYRNSIDKKNQDDQRCNPSSCNRSDNKAG